MEIIKYSTYFADQGWYPGDAESCRRQMDEYLNRLASMTLPDIQARAGIVPHAGWTFSGALAAMTIGALAQLSGAVDTVVLLGGHLGPGSRSWIITHGRWPTPVGDLEVDPELAREIGEQTGLRAVGPADYRPDNTIELQLPLIRRCFPESRVVVAGVPADAGCLEVGRHVVRAANGLHREIVVIGSTDLTHYGPNYGFAPQGSGKEAVKWVKEVNDKRAVELMCGVQGETLLREVADTHFCCCPGAVAATLGAVREWGLHRGHALSSLTSYDVRPGSSFVGYAAVVF